MNREQLREKILEHSNSMFPLIDFFNDIGKNKDPRYDKERAYEDIEKIYDLFMYYREKSEKLEKENQELKEKVNHFEKVIEDIKNLPDCPFKRTLINNNCKYMFVKGKLTPLPKMPELEELKNDNQ